VYCPKCGKAVGDEDLFCRWCGYELPKRRSEVDSSGYLNQNTTGDGGGNDASQTVDSRPPKAQAQEEAQREKKKTENVIRRLLRRLLKS